MSFDYIMGHVWLPQMGRRPFPSLFSSELDIALLEDYKRRLPQIKEAGFDFLVLYGLIGENGANQLPVDLDHGFSPKRDAIIRQIIDLVHGAGLKFIHAVVPPGFRHIALLHPEIAGRRYKFRGLGSGWQQDHTMRYNADLLDLYDVLDAGEIKPGNTAPDPWGEPQDDVLCGSTEETWYWKERALRFIIGNYKIDGFHFEPGDLGRCMCPKCRKIENLTYHAQQSERTTALIRQIAPQLLVGVSSSGVRVDGLRSLPAMRQWSKGANYFADPTTQHLIGVDMLRAPEGPSRTLIDDREIIARELEPVAYGPLLHVRDSGLPRNAWFQPCPRTLVQTVSEASRTGCRLMQYYALGAFDNAGHELNNYIVGYAANHPEDGWRTALEAVVERLYRPRSAAGREGLAELFSATEMSCLYNDVSLNMHFASPLEREKYAETINREDFNHTGVTALDLVSAATFQQPATNHLTPKMPVPYLIEATGFQKIRHLRELERYLGEARKLRGEIGSEEHATKLLSCLEGTIADVRQETERTLNKRD